MHGSGNQVFFSGGGYFFGVAPVLVIGPGGFLPPIAWMGPGFLPAREPLLPPPPPGFLGRNGANVPGQRKDKPADLARSAHLATLGDRLFRAGNLKKAEERYLQAMRLAPDLASPRVRLAQVAIARGQFEDAAIRIREAETVQPGWISTAPDIQTIYGEPKEFARTLERLESHLQAHPDDRDGWLVLGAQLFLSGRTSRAADVFKRLDDPNRKADAALAAFLDASNQGQRRPDAAPDPNDSVQ
jgi:tetratricopeptide (TPR) repeat protein